MFPLQTPPPVLSTQARTEKIEGLDGSAKTLQDLGGRVLFLALYGQGSGEAAGKLSADLALSFALQKGEKPEPAFRCVSVADLGTAPGFLRGAIRRGVREGAKKGEEKTRQQFTAQHLDYEKTEKPIYLLDWGGVLARELGVNGKTARTYQVFLLGKKGEILFHYAPSAKPRKDEDPLSQIKRALEKALK